MADLMVTDWQK